MCGSRAVSKRDEYFRNGMISVMPFLFERSSRFYVDGFRVNGFHVAGFHVTGIKNLRFWRASG